MNRLIIVGASGHGKVVRDIAILNGYRDITFVDDNEHLLSCGKYAVDGTTADVFHMEGDVFVAIGNSRIRQRLLFIYHNRTIPVLIHPNAVVAKDVRIGEGSVVMAGVVINPEVSIGKGCIVNTSSSVDHDCVVGDYSHISVNAHLCGNVLLGNNVWVGVGASVINNIHICDDCMIGAGAVVIHNIDIPGTYVGIPAHMNMKCGGGVYSAPDQTINIYSRCVRVA